MYKGAPPQGNPLPRTREREKKMADFREICEDYHSRASADERSRVEALFESLDVDKDKKLSKPEVLVLLELPVRLGLEQSAEWAFPYLDKDSSGSLDLKEFLPFYYHWKSRFYCAACQRNLGMDFYFSCVLCWDMCINHKEEGEILFNLCNGCYNTRHIQHPHIEFLDVCALLGYEKRKQVFLSLSEKRKPEEKVTQKREEMREISKEAKFFYERLTNEDQRRRAVAWFNKIDVNGDGKVSKNELIYYLTTNGGFDHAEASEMFEVMDMELSHSLDFEDMLALCYSLLTRPWCDMCGYKMTRSYYRCRIPCQHDFMGNSDTYYLCLDCYNKRNINHQDHPLLDGQTMQEKHPLQRVNSYPGTMAQSNPAITKKRTLREKILKTLEFLAPIATIASAVVAPFVT